MFDARFFFLSFIFIYSLFRSVENRSILVWIINIHSENGYMKKYQILHKSRTKLLICKCPLNGFCTMGTIFIHERITGVYLRQRLLSNRTSVAFSTWPRCFVQKPLHGEGGGGREFSFWEKRQGDSCRNLSRFLSRPVGIW